ncbi:signal peptide peptidase SppA [Candidatus Woesearchaeota archaeon]|nr:signal peptide peptidase SppA [Candidatus Woesearchaeota archaeon]
MEKPKPRNKWITALIILAILAFLSYVVAGIISLFAGTGEFTDINAGNVAIVSIKGFISTESGSLLFDEQGTSSTDAVEALKKAEDASNIKAILLEIDSPGGTPVATDEIAQQIKKSKKLTVAWIREVGASGAYWVASSADIVVANRMSAVGSIGVLGSYVQFEGLFNKYGVKYERLVSGEYKDIGSPFRNMTSAERLLIQAELDSLHRIFIDEVKQNRKLSDERMAKISTGMFFFGTEAKDLGLVDVLGGKEEALKIIETNLNITASPVEIRKKESLSDVLSRLSGGLSYQIGLGIGNSIVTKANRNSVTV